MMTPFSLTAGLILWGLCLAQNKPTKAQELLRLLTEGRSIDLMLELGRTDEPQVIPALRAEEERCRQGRTGRDICSAVAQALARLGDENAFNQIVSDLKSKDPLVQSAVMLKLRYVRGKRTLRLLRHLLDDDTPRPPRGDMVFLPLNYEAMRTLAEIVPNPPLGPVPYPFPKYVEIWKQWFRDHPEATR